MQREALWSYARVERREDEPAPDARWLDVAVLDMNHGWPNLGHDSLVNVLRAITCDLSSALGATGFGVRVVSYDVRRHGVVPAGPSERFRLFLGTGGPGHLDPRENDGVRDSSQGVREDPSWEAPLFALFDGIARDERAALLAVCHTFGLLCRWSGAARPELRGPEKGGKSAGVLENELTEEALAHPWFSRFASATASRRIRILDSRLFDLIPEGALPPGAVPLGFETRGISGPRGDAITMIEFARDRAGVMPRFFGVNHHPEILERHNLLQLLRRKLDAGEVTQEWYDERLKVLTTTYPGEDSDRLVALTSQFTLVAPIRYHLTRLVRERAEARGVRGAPHEDATLRFAPAGA